MENISVCNTMQKQTHYEYYYFNKLIQVYKARKQILLSLDFSNIQQLYHGAVDVYRTELKYLRAHNHFLIENWANSLSLVIFNRSDDWEIAFPIKMIMS